MGLLYPEKEEIKYSLDIKQVDGICQILFTANCGKFGTDEIIDGWQLTPTRLLQILQERDDYSEDEL